MEHYAPTLAGRRQEPNSLGTKKYKVSGKMGISLFTDGKNVALHPEISDFETDGHITQFVVHRSDGIKELVTTNLHFKVFAQLLE